MVAEDPQSMQELAQGKLSIKTAVKEVVGRSLYYLKNQNHFVYRTSVGEGEVEDQSFHGA